MRLEEEARYWKQRMDAVSPPKMGKFVPFRARFKVGSPVCITTPWISFDGLIAHLLLLWNLGEDYFITPKKLPILEFVSPSRGKQGFYLPLKKTGKIYHASVSQFIPNALKITQIYKRFEPQFASSLKKKKISIGSGEFRSYILQEPYVPCREVIFYAYGDMNLVQELIENYLVGLGNDVRIGFGIIRDVVFEKMDEDYSIIADGIAMRPIPIEMCEEYEEAVYLAYRPPYWDPKNVAECVPPGARCRFKWT